MISVDDVSVDDISVDGISLLIDDLSGDYLDRDISTFGTLPILRPCSSPVDPASRAACAVRYSHSCWRLGAPYLEPGRVCLTPGQVLRSRVRQLLLQQLAAPSNNIKTPSRITF